MNGISKIDRGSPSPRTAYLSSDLSTDIYAPLKPLLLTFFIASAFLLTSIRPSKASCFDAFSSSSRRIISQKAQAALNANQTYLILSGGERLSRESRDLLKGVNSKGAIEVEWARSNLKLPRRFPNRNPSATLLDQLSHKSLEFPDGPPLDHIVLPRDFNAKTKPNTPHKRDINKKQPRVEDLLLRSNRRKKKRPNPSEENPRKEDLLITRYEDRIEFFERKGSQIARESLFVWKPGDGSSPLFMEISPGGDFLIFRSETGITEILSARDFESIHKSQRSIERELHVFEDTNGHPLILEIKPDKKAMEVFSAGEKLVSTGYTKTFDLPIQEVVIPSRKSPEFAMLIFKGQNFEDGNYSRKNALGPYAQFVALRQEVLEDPNYNPGDLLSPGPRKPQKPLRRPIDSRTNDPSLKDLSEGDRRQRAKEAQEDQFKKDMKEYQAQMEAYEKATEKKVITTVIDGDIGSMLRTGGVFEAPNGEIPVMGALSKYFARSSKGVGAIASENGIYLFDATQKAHWKIRLKAEKNSSQNRSEELKSMKFITPAHLRGLEAQAPLLFVHSQVTTPETREYPGIVRVYEWRGSDHKPALLFKIKAPENIDALRVTELLDNIDLRGENGDVFNLEMISRGDLIIERETAKN
jgi:hypothetical protein